MDGFGRLYMRNYVIFGLLAAIAGPAPRDARARRRGMQGPQGLHQTRNRGRTEVRRHLYFPEKSPRRQCVIAVQGYD